MEVTDSGGRKYLNKKLHQCHLPETNVKWRSELEPEPLKLTICDWSYEPQCGGIFKNYVKCGINKFSSQWLVLAMKRNNMRYIFNKMCVTYRIMFINSRCNKTTQHENVKQQPCFKHAGRTQE